MRYEAERDIACGGVRNSCHGTRVNKTMLLRDGRACHERDVNRSRRHMQDRRAEGAHQPLLVKASLDAGLKGRVFWDQSAHPCLVEKAIIYTG